jgi:hypothetical protein
MTAEHKFIHIMLHDGRIADETRRHIEHHLDLEEASLVNCEYRETPLPRRHTACFSRDVSGLSSPISVKPARIISSRL